MPSYPIYYTCMCYCVYILFRHETDRRDIYLSCIETLTNLLFLLVQRFLVSLSPPMASSKGGECLIYSVTPHMLPPHTKKPSKFVWKKISQNENGCCKDACHAKIWGWIKCYGSRKKLACLVIWEKIKFKCWELHWYSSIKKLRAS